MLLLIVSLFIYLFITAYRYIKNVIIDNKINFALLFVLSILMLYVATGAMYMYYFFILLVILHRTSCIDGYMNKKLF